MPTELQQHPPSSALPEYPITILDFQRMFPDEEACLRYLERVRWPNGFCCEKCASVEEPFRLSTHPRKLKCRVCHHVESVTGDTAMHRSKTSIHVWFW
ncbi:MAG: ISSod11, transposase, partial [uncultured bacterium]